MDEKKLRGRKARYKKIIDQGLQESSVLFAKRSLLATSVILFLIVAVSSITFAMISAYEGLELALVLIAILPIVLVVFFIIDLVCVLISILNLKWQFKLNKTKPTYFALGLLIASQVIIVVLAIILLI